MVTLKYPLADLARRRSWTLASLACFVSTTASQTCLSLTGFTLAFGPSLFTTKAPTSLQSLFSSLLTFMTLISVAASASIFAGMSLSQTAGRRRDMAVMKALGLTGEVSSFFVAETLLTSIAGVLSGIAAGVLVYTMIGMTVGPVFGPWPTPYPWSLASFTIVSILSAFLSSYVPIRWMIAKMNVVDALARRTQGRGRSIEPIVRRFGLTIRFAIRDALNRRSETLAAFLLATLSVFLLSLLLLGGHTALYTTRSYIQRGVGEQVTLIANPETAQAYLERLSFSGNRVARDWLNPSGRIPPPFLNWLQGQHGLIVDVRLVAETTAHEVAFVEALPGPSYRTVGDERSREVLVVGLHPETTVGNWVSMGRGLSEGDEEEAVIGDSLLGAFADWSLERISLWGRTLPIVGVAMDPLNLGNTVYIPYGALGNILSADGPNIVLVKNLESTQDISGIVDNEASKYGLATVELDEVVDKNTVGLDRLWASVSWIDSLGLIATSAGLASYLVASVQTWADDLKTVLSIGSPWRRIIRIIWAENALIMVPAGLLGTIFGGAFSFRLLVLSPTLPPINTLAIDILTILATLGLMSLVSVVMASAYLKRSLSMTRQ